MLNWAHRDRQQAGAAPHSNFARYAILYTPQPGTALSAFGRSWFGRANDGVTLQAFSDAGLSGASFARLAPARGRYTGLHALVMAPFTPRDGIGTDALKTRLINFAGRRKPLATGPLTLARAGRFLVLRPVEAMPALDWLAAQCVASFEDFAAPPSDAECCEHANPKLSDSRAPALAEQPRSQCVERVSLLDHAHRSARHRASRTGGASALACARRDLRHRRHGRWPLAVRR